MVTAKAVKQRLLTLLPSIDLDSVTERGIRDTLAAELGPIDKHFPLIKKQIETFLEQQGGSDLEGDGNYREGDGSSDDESMDDEVEEEDDEHSEGAEGSKKRPAEKQPTTRANKAAKGAGSKDKAGTSKATAGTSNDHVIDLGGHKRLSISVFKGITLVDMREYYTDKSSGEEKPGAKGIALHPEQWLVLAGALPTLLSGLEAGDEAVVVQLGPLRRAYISAFKGRHSVHVREMYEKDGHQLPGKKGVTLDAAALRLLQEKAVDVAACLGPTSTAAAQTATATLAGTAAPAAAAAGSASAGASVAADGTAYAAAEAAGTSGAAQGTGVVSDSAAAVVTPSSPPATAAASAPAADPANAAGAAMVDLGGGKRVSVSTFVKNKPGIDLREYYQKGDKWLPGKKGILLMRDDWAAFVAGAAAVSLAVAAKDEAFSLKLSGMRHVTVSSFKSKWYVQVREMYEKAGKLLPGTKGLGLSVEQWTLLEAAMPQLTKALQGI